MPAPSVLPPSVTLPAGLPDSTLAELTALWAHLDPRDPMERLLATRVLQAAARLQLSAAREPDGAPDALWLRYESAADRLFRQSLTALERHRRDRPEPSNTLPPGGGPGRGGEQPATPARPSLQGGPDGTVRAAARPQEASGQPISPPQPKTGRVVADPVPSPGLPSRAHRPFPSGWPTPPARASSHANAPQPLAPVT